MAIYYIIINNKVFLDFNYIEIVFGICFKPSFSNTITNMGSRETPCLVYGESTALIYYALSSQMLFQT